MKYIIIIITLLLLQSCRYSGTKEGIITTAEQYNIVKQEMPTDSIVGAYLHLYENRYNFGKVSIRKTPHITIEFGMENRGKLPLVIYKADVSCGCMSVDIPTTPIFPGACSKLTVTIETKGQEGVFNKPIFVKSNADNDVVLIRILGEIEK